VAECLRKLRSEVIVASVVVAHALHECNLLRCQVKGLLVNAIPDEYKQSAQALAWLAAGPDGLPAQTALVNFTKRLLPAIEQCLLTVFMKCGVLARRNAPVDAATQAKIRERVSANFFVFACTVWIAECSGAAARAEVRLQRMLNKEPLDTSTLGWFS
jgi:hypothetical protein